MLHSFLFAHLSPLVWPQPMFISVFLVLPHFDLLQVLRSVVKKLGVEFECDIVRR